MIKAIIFDMDGVLLDSESVCDRNWMKILKEMGLPEDYSVINACRGTNKQDTSRIIQEYYGKDFDVPAFLQKAHDLFYEVESTVGIPLMPYAAESLERLNPHYKLALASSTRFENIKRELTNTNVFHYFETVIAGDMVIHSKPDPEIYKMAIAGVGLKAEECIAIEDSPNGIKSAVGAGMKVIMVPDRIAPTPELEKLCWKIFPNLKEACDFLLKSKI